MPDSSAAQFTLLPASIISDRYFSLRQPIDNAAQVCAPTRAVEHAIDLHPVALERLAAVRRAPPMS